MKGVHGNVLTGSVRLEDDGRLALTGIVSVRAEMPAGTTTVVRTGLFVDGRRVREATTELSSNATVQIPMQALVEAQRGVSKVSVGAVAGAVPNTEESHVHVTVEPVSLIVTAMPR
jgi:hypothetical protein